MRVLLAQLAPVKGDVEANLRRVETIAAAAPVDLAVFPELFLTGYRVGDRVHALAVASDGPEVARLSTLARRLRRALVVGTARRHPGRLGEVENVALFSAPDGSVSFQVKRYLPTYGPFEEGSFFTPTSTSVPVDLNGHRLGLEICYDAFFPEVTRGLAMAGAELFVAISAAPVTSRRLFDKVLPARAVENAAPLVYVNRVGVEDGVVFGGGSGAWDARGEPCPSEELAFPRAEAEESLTIAEVDLTEAARWRPFRPVLRDLSHGSSGEPTPPGDRSAGRST